MGIRERRAMRPVLERVERRDLLSGIMASMIASAPPVPSSAILVRNRGAVQITSPSFSGNTGGVGNGTGLNNNSSSPLLGNGTPSTRELLRENYRAGFTGRLYTGSGRFSDQGTTYYYRGLGGSNFFLHGDFNMTIVTPTDPSKAFFGEAVLNDKSNGTSGIQGFILAGDRASVDSKGRPTQLTFTADPNIYSGTFFVQAAQGNVDISYGANNTITTKFSGLVYTNGLANPLVNSDLYARHGRPLKYHPRPVGKG